VQGNFIGTDVSGTMALGNGLLQPGVPSAGVFVGTGANNNRVGGGFAGEGNLISGNNLGVNITHSSTTGNIVRGNFIGTDVTGQSGISNTMAGILIFNNASGNIIGGTFSDQGNRIAFNGSHGIKMDSGTNNALLGNSIFTNRFLGIDLGANGTTANDPGDADEGANHFQNFPVLTNAVGSANQTRVQVSLNSAATTEYRIELFANAACDNTGFGEGQTFLVATNVTTDANGDAVFSMEFPLIPPGLFLTATATDPDGNTSEFSRCVPVPVYPPGDVNASFTVTGADSLLINQVIVGLRSNTHPIFAGTGYANGDVNQNGTVSGADSLFINQTIVGLRAYLTTKIVPGARPANVPTPVAIFGIGFPTNEVPVVQIGSPVDLMLSDVVVMNRELITAVVPPGGGSGTGVVEVIYASTNGVVSFGRFINP
jgi:hypothetical protein